MANFKSSFKTLSALTIISSSEEECKINNSSNNVNDFKFLIDSDKKDKVISFAKYFYGKTHVTFYDKNTKNEIWSGYMNTSKEILNELKYIIHNSWKDYFIIV